MNRSDRKKINELHHLHAITPKITQPFNDWLSTFFWEADAQEEITDFCEMITQEHGGISSVSSGHPLLQERTPIHLYYLYRHELFCRDGTIIVLFQKFNFSRNFTSLFTSLTWAYLSNLSTVFRSMHRQYEKSQHRSVQLVHPNPRSLWENYKTFLTTLGVHWKNHYETVFGPVWVVLTDVTAVTVAVPGKHQVVGTSVYTHLVNALHSERFQKKQYKILGKVLGKTIRSCYEQRVAFIDVGLGNYIIDSESVARFIDGELLQVFPDEVPSHYKALELVMFLETLYLETLRDYCRTFNSRNSEEIKKYQRGLLLFSAAFLAELRLSHEDLVLAKRMYLDWSTKLGTFFFTFILSLHRDPQVIRRYRGLLREELLLLLDGFINKLD
jgi:hypothetical protein